MKLHRPLYAKMIVALGVVLIVTGAWIYFDNFLGMYEVADQCGTGKSCSLEQGDERLERLASLRVTGQIIMAAGTVVILLGVWLKKRFR